MGFTSIFGRQVAKGLRSIDRWDREQTFNEQTIQMQDDVAREKKDREAKGMAYKRCFGVWPGGTWRW